jgi:site-specific DNA recombinase
VSDRIRTPRKGDSKNPKAGAGESFATCLAPSSGPVLRAATYIRVSSEEQVTGHSLDAQRTSTRALIAQRGWLFAGEYVDAGLSAKPGAHRPALSRLLADVRKGWFDVVVVDKVDRFYRHLKGLLIALDTLNEANVSFVSVRENLDLSTPWGKLTLTVLGMLAEIYIDNLRDETRKGKVQRARKGLYNGSIPFGYCLGNCSSCTDPNGEGYCPHYGGPDRGDGEVPVPHPIESAAVALAFEWYLTTDYSDGMIAERLNAYEHRLPDGAVVHFRTKGRLGRFPPARFTKDSVRHILQRPFYAGLVAYYGRDAENRKRKRGQVESTYAGRHEPLISREDFEQAQELRRQLVHRSREKRTGKPNIHPLSGLIVCDTCGRPLRAMQTARGYRYYRDTSRIEHRGTCDQPTLRAEEIEDQVSEFLGALSRCLPPNWQEVIEAAVIPDGQRDTLREREREIRARLDRATRLHLEGHITYDEFMVEKRQAQAALADLRPAELSDIIAVGAVLADFDRRWDQATEPSQKNGLLRMALAEVRVQRYALTAVQPSVAAYPLMQVFCRSGSDGHSGWFQVTTASPLPHLGDAQMILPPLPTCLFGST